MTLPATKANELLEHVAECPACRRVRDKRPGARYCPAGRALIVATLKERHGPRNHTIGER